MWRRLARSSALVAARATAVRRVDVSRLHTRLAVCVPCTRHLAASSRALSSFSNTPYEARSDDIKVRDLALHELVRRPWVELQEYYGPVEMSKVRQTLPMTWKELSIHADGSAVVAPEIVEDFYEAARRCRLPKLQRDVFNYMETHYLYHISFTMYVQMFDNLMAAKEFQRMRGVYERGMTRYDHEQRQTPPEIIYRIGISAAIALEDFRGVKTLMRDMEANGVKPSVEIVTRVMVAQATKGEVKTVVEAAKKLDPQDGRKWHEADVNRVITSLGIAGEPDLALDFFRRSQSRLTPKTLMKLLIVCRENSRPKHALALLANRRRFGVKMLPAQYPTMLEIVEELGIGGAPGNELVLILKEMRDNGAPFSDRVHALIARNLELLHGTPFMLISSPSQDGHTQAHVEMESESRTKEADTPLLHELLDARKFAQAAAIVDSYAVPVSDASNPTNGQEKTSLQDEEAIIVPPWLADMAVEAYSQNQEIDKVRSLLRGFLCVRGDFKHALSRIIGLFGGKGRLRDSRMAYDAFLAMQFQGLPIFRVRDALTRFKQNQNSEATFVLLKQVSKQIGEALKDTNCVKTAARHQEDFMGVLKRSDALSFDPARTVRDVLRIFLSLKRLDLVVAALDQLESDGIPIRAVDYENIFNTMTKNTKDGKLYTAEDFMKVWEDMTRRNVIPNKATLRVAIPVLCGQEGVCDDGWKRRKLAIIEGYHQAANDRFDNYVLPIACFSTLLEAAAETGSIEDVNAIHSGAVKALGMTMNKKHHSPDDHSKILETWSAIKAEKIATKSTHGST
ncbi:hypothetical protein L914_14160 [Phytophthora nicotianae]|uniref:Pentacotripeptide-repeat region of PRORP domain-containing protein n=1 Tax=Phytophthora nicotianae TaxID=4792 RepID=W2MTT9_PHYNI|nr:hypothetical protein L914_14160 [Phytophthora nicotianae]